MSFLWRSHRCSNASLQQNSADLEQLSSTLCCCASGSKTLDDIVTNVLCKLPCLM